MPYWHNDHANHPGEFTEIACRNEDRVAPQSLRMLERPDLVHESLNLSPV